MRPGFRLPPLLLTNEEAFALSLGLRALRHLGLAAFAPATEAALAKLGRVLPDALRESVRTVEEVVAVEPGPWVVPTSVECLTQAASAIRLGRRIRFAYQSHSGVTSHRELEPFAVLHTDGRWYLIGHCLSRQAIRTFRLDRITDIKISSDIFDRPPTFNARRYMAEHMPFAQSRYQIDVWIDMPLEDAERSFLLWRVTTEAQDGGTRLRCGRDTLDLFAASLLGTGQRIVVNSPPELRETFRKIATQALQAAASRIE